MKTEAISSDQTSEAGAGRGNRRGMITMKKKIILAGLLFLAVFAARAHAEMELARINTQAGELVIMERTGQRLLFLKDETLYLGTDFLSVYRIFRLKDLDIIMIRDFTGPIHCPVQYLFLTLSPNGKWRTSPSFGHCADKPDVSLKGRITTVKFKAFGTLAPETWTFDGNNLLRIN